jgi:hypothetical protein
MFSAIFCAYCLILCDPSVYGNGLDLYEGFQPRLPLPILPKRHSLWRWKLQCLLRWKTSTVYMAYFENWSYTLNCSCENLRTRTVIYLCSFYLFSALELLQKSASILLEILYISLSLYCHAILLLICILSVLCWIFMHMYPVLCKEYCIYLRVKTIVMFHVSSRAGLCMAGSIFSDSNAIFFAKACRIDLFLFILQLAWLSQFQVSTSFISCAKFTLFLSFFFLSLSSIDAHFENHKQSINTLC